MGTAERRLEILKYLCKNRHEKMTQLAEIFGVSVRTIQRDIYEIEMIFHIPLCVKCGKYESGVYVVGNYSFDHAYMRADELLLLKKIQELVKSQLTKDENISLAKIINSYTKTA